MGISTVDVPLVSPGLVEVEVPGATAQVLTNESGTTLIAFVTYDTRLFEHAKNAGLPVASPGQD